MRIWFCLFSTLGLLVMLYWLIVVGEGTYLGRYVVRFIYQHGARFYDTTRQGVTSNDTALLLPLLSASLKGVTTPQVLDVATGTGRVPLLLASQPWFDGTIIGVDFSSAMLAHARAKIAAAGLHNRIMLLEGDASRLSWPDSSFDLVVSLEALEYFPRPRHALSEMARTLRPGGTLLVSKYIDRWARILPFKGLTRHQMIKQLYQHGLVDIQILDWQPGNYELVLARKRL